MLHSAAILTFGVRNNHFMMTETPKKIQLKGMTLEKISDYLTEIGEPAYRAKQVFDWMYNRNAASYADMLNLPKALRDTLAEQTILTTLNLITVQESPGTKTKKLLLETSLGNKIEAVIIPEEKRVTLCVSTQVGCPLDCQFCATGFMGYKRNLTPGEIIDQYLIANRAYEKPITNIVFMGMGEPLLNYQATLDVLKIFAGELSSTGVSLKKITVSTAGIPEKIRALSDSGLKIKLALSLHSPFEDIRTQIMPINQKYPLSDCLDAVRYHAKMTGTRITFEYVMLNGVNDRDADIKGLKRICSSVPSKLNLIPFNSLEHIAPAGYAAELRPTPRERIEEFAQKLRDANITVMIRNTQGDDIAAACGQLAITGTTTS